MTAIVARNGELRVTWPDGIASLDLGAAADKWAEKIRNPPSRLQKIGVKPDWIGVGARRRGHGLPRKSSRGPCPGSRSDARVKNSDAIFVGATRTAQLARLRTIKSSLKPNGALWVVRPKGRPEIPESAVMAAGKAAGLVDVKVVSFSPTHTAEKFVIPVAKRR